MERKRYHCPPFCGCPLYTASCDECGELTDINRNLCTECGVWRGPETYRPDHSDPRFGSGQWGTPGFCGGCGDECIITYHGLCSHCYGDDRGRPSWAIIRAEDLPKPGTPVR